MYFSRLGRRVDRMEQSIGSTVSKLDAILMKLESMEKVRHNKTFFFCFFINQRLFSPFLQGKARRKATMGRILAGITEDTEGEIAVYLNVFVEVSLSRIIRSCT